MAIPLVAAIRAILAAREAVRAMNSAINILKVLAEIGSKAPKIGARVADALANGTLDPDDVEEFAVNAAKDIDIKVKVHGIDVVGELAEAHFLAFIGLVTAATVRAKVQ